LMRLFANPAARVRTWQFVQKKWDQDSKRLPPMMISRVVDSTPSLRSREYKQEVAAFFKAHPVPTARRAMQQALERFDLNYEFSRRVAKSLAAWLAKNRDRD